MKKSEINLQRFRDGLYDAGDNYGYLCACYNIVCGKEYLIRIYGSNMSKLAEKYFKKRDIDSSNHPEELASNIFREMLASVGIDIQKNEEEKEMNESNISETFCAYCKAINDVAEANGYIVEHRCERIYDIPLYCKAAIFDNEQDLENNKPNCTIISLPESIVKSSNPALFALEKFYKNIKRKEVE